MLLNGEWKLSFCQQTPELESQGQWKQISAQVPGNVELDLVRAGLEKDPFYDENLYDFRKYEFTMWKFEKDFTLPEALFGQRLSLTLEGVNTYADVFLNGVKLGSTQNMFIAHSFDITGAVNKGQNSLTVLIHSAAQIARKFSYTAHMVNAEFVWQRKPPHSFGWDIMPRLPSAGLWRDVHIDVVAPKRFTQVYVGTRTLTRNSAGIAYQVEFAGDTDTLDGYSLRISGDGFCLQRPVLFTAANGTFEIPSPRLWWPAGYGEANLYDVKFELLYNGQPVDTVHQRIGVRKIEIVHKMLPGDDGEFLVKVNDQPILLKGSNWVPLDALHSRDVQRYDRALALFHDCGCNIARSWGGNVYEDHRFFDLCDEYGILVWQDFAMACATYPQGDDFARIIEEEATAVVRKLRNHPCILLWAGDNEVDETYTALGYVSPENNVNRITREILPRVVRQNDPLRKFLPSSPFIDNGVARYDVPEQHNWGARGYFKDEFYKNTKAHFISECGYHGCPAPESLARFLPAEKLWPYTNSAWTTHDTDYLPAGERAYNRNQLMADQVGVLFGTQPDTLEEFSYLSQVSQAEAKKFFIERTRVKKWRRTGIIWWNMLDGWPQISDAVVDYYFVKKRAYNYIKRVQKPVCVILDELKDWTHNIVLCNDSLQDARVEVEITDGDSGQVLFTDSTVSKANENAVLGTLRILPGVHKLFLIRFTVNGVPCGNHYITGFPPYDPQQMKNWTEKIDALPV